MAYEFLSADTAMHAEDSPWDDAPGHTEEAGWARMAGEYTNAGYREGITAGKEAALQEGFDAAFARVGVPLGRQLGVLRGTCAALVAFLASSSSSSSSSPSDPTARMEVQTYLEEAREIQTQLARVRFSDVDPGDEEAERHAREHAGEDEGLGVEMEMVGGDEGAERRRVEAVEDMLERMGVDGREGERGKGRGRPTVGDVRRLRERLEGLLESVGVEVDLS
ncbi:hypothetical protein GLOTRDRAFT_130096 [Gloeophyllum trabeum ATCC 11539]|uniref:Protein YAE1 n=1 Tax=Gloeophyllum trabeum (strain ATCC 11539 / FP-39264 / Madison 617) TaxID=670483 RepID=S7RPY5_GLOTA|nr:uncharacterized protein GLOTRDRAFT_130096 [Gloeophyllum trabeum ATCC 11539]EPQ54949.1 hypothetical protein GLOTRDRAFT_130096 [Gloeophyllum trabeum ATCC 11539]